MSFFSHLRHRGFYNSHMGGAYYQQPNYAPQAGIPMVQCPRCQAAVAANCSFCSSCGLKMGGVSSEPCSECGYSIPSGAGFCPGCGKKVR